MSAFQPMVVSALMLALAGTAAAEEPLLTDLRVTVGSNQRDYVSGDTHDHFDSGVDAGCAFVYGLRPLTSGGTWFFGGTAHFASAKDTDDSDGVTGTFRRLMLGGLAGYAAAVPDLSMVHVEIGPYAGAGLVFAQFTDTDTEHNSFAPALEGGVRVASYVTWGDAIQLGIEAEYGLLIGRQALTNEGVDWLTTQGFSIAMGLGVRIH